jgi:phage-related protein
MNEIKVSATQVTKHEYEIPCQYSERDGYHAEYKQLMYALRMAEQKAASLGMNTTTDNWCHISPSDESVVIWFYQKGPIF